MFDFYVDKRGGTEKNESTNDDIVQSLNPITADRLSLCDKLPELLTVTKSKKIKSDSDNDLTDTYLITNYCQNLKDKTSLFSNVNKLLETKSSITPELEKMHAIPIIKESVAKALRKKERKRTKGEDWYNLPATEVTDEVKNDLQILKMRSVLDKKHFYKKNNVKNISKYFQVGKVVENAADFYSGRIVKSQRRKTIVDELLADAEFKRYQKKKYKEIMDTKRRKIRSRVYLKSKNKKN